MAAAVAVLVGGLSHVAGEERLAMKVSPTVAFAPAHVVVWMTIPANAGNRAILIEAESASFYRSSESQLDGDRAAQNQHVELDGLPAGDYLVTGTLKGAGDAEIASIQRELRVIASTP